MGKITKIESGIPRLPARKKVAAYARVSMETERLRHSLSAQVSYYSALIQRTPGWECAGVYADGGISGTGTKGRSEFLRLLSDCEAGKIDVVLCKSISRFARNTLDLLKTVRRLKELGISVRFEKENIDTLSSDGELLLALLASFAQEESRSISENCKWGIRKRYERGETRNCKIYGYRVRDGKLAVDKGEAEVVRRIFRMFLDGDSCYAIARALEKEGVRSYTGKRLRGEVIADMLRQEKYAGCTLSQKYFTPDPVTHKELRNDGRLPMYFAEGTHPAIVAMDTFRAAQEEFVKRYGVEIVNGIAKRAKYFHRKKGERGKYPPHRSPKWPEESRKAQSERQRKRKEGNCKYDFSRFIECENCGGHLQASLRHHADGSCEVRWLDDEHTKRNPGSPRPVVLRDDALKRQVAVRLGWEKFDAGRMFAEIGKIGVREDTITLRFKDGRKRRFRYLQPKRARKKRKKAD